MKRTLTMLVTIVLVGLLFAGFAGTAAAGSTTGDTPMQDADATVGQNQGVTQYSDSDQGALAFGEDATVEQSVTANNYNDQTGTAQSVNVWDQSVTVTIG